MRQHTADGPAPLGGGASRTSSRPAPRWSWQEEPGLEAAAHDGGGGAATNDAAAVGRLARSTAATTLGTMAAATTAPLEQRWHQYQQQQYQHQRQQQPSSSYQHQPPLSGWRVVQLAVVFVTLIGLIFAQAYADPPAPTAPFAVVLVLFG